MKQRSVYVDMQKTDFNKKQVFFREGFAETEYFAYKKLLQESARTVYAGYADMVMYSTLTLSKPDKS